MSKCRFCSNEKDHEKGKHCKSCNFAFMTGRQEALTKAKGLVREVQLQSWEQERERIIELLKNKEQQYAAFIEKMPDRTNIAEFHAVARTYQAAIALIKGENK